MMHAAPADDDGGGMMNGKAIAVHETATALQRGVCRVHGDRRHTIAGGTPLQH